MEELRKAISRQPRFLHNKNAPKNKCKTKTEVESENEEINEIAKDRKTNIIKRKNNNGRNGQ